MPDEYCLCVLCESEEGGCEASRFEREGFESGGSEGGRFESGGSERGKEEGDRENEEIALRFRIAGVRIRAISQDICELTVCG